MEAKQRIYIASRVGGELETALQQGEILSGLIQANLSVPALASKQILVDQKIHTFAVILSQDCDLTQDFNKRTKPELEVMVPNVLFCEATSAETMKAKVDNRAWRDVPKNKNERYHFLQKIDRADDSLVEGIYELGIDFKRYFTIPTDEVYFRLRQGEAVRRSILVSPYLEHLSFRFSYFLSRVALVRDHESE